MQIPKDQIVSMIESRMGSDQAQQAAQQLPDQVDHEGHAELLNQLGINPQDLIGGAGSGESREADPGSAAGDQSEQSSSW